MLKKHKVSITAIIYFLCTPFAMADTICVITAGLEASFWQEIHAGAQKAGSVLAVDIVNEGPADELDSENQGRLVRDAANKQCDALVLSPNSMDRKKDVAWLKNQGISTVYVDFDIGGERLGVIKTDNFEAGKKAGMKMAEALQGKKRVAVFHVGKDSYASLLRRKGFIESAKAAGLEVVANEDIGTAVKPATKAALELLKNRTDIDGIFTTTETACMGTLLALQQLNKTKDVLHIGFDSNSKIMGAIQESRLYGTIVQQPYRMGYYGVHAAYRSLHGEKIQDKISTDTIFLTRDNIDSVEAKKHDIQF